MSEVRTLRAAPSLHTLPATRSPERERLAAAIVSRTAANDMLARIRDARPAAWDAINEAEACLAQWENAVRLAREDAPRNVTAATLGEPPVGMTVAAATAGLDATLAELEDRRGLSVALSARERTGADDLSAAERAVREAVAGVIGNDPACLRLVADYTRARDLMVAIGLIFSMTIRVAGGSPHGANRVRNTIDGTREYYDVRAAEAAPWERAVTALFNDPDFPLPNSVEPGAPPPRAA
jgi:hypothetical protein